MKQLFATEGSKAKTVEEEKNKDENNQKSIIESDDFLESLLGNEFIYKINLCEEDVSDYINNKKTDSLKKLLSNNKNFNQNYIISLNSENLLNIYNTKKYQKQKKKTNLKTSKFLLSVIFDEKVNFYDLEKDLKNNMKIEKGKKKSEKVLLIGVKQSEENYSYAYVFKITKDIYIRFSKSISSKGRHIKNKEILGEEKESEESDNEINYDDLTNEINIDKNQKGSSTKKDIFGFGDSDNDSEKGSNIKKDKEKEKESNKEGIIKTNIRGNIKQLTFGVNAFPNFKRDNLNESDEKDDDKEDKKNNNSSEDISDSSNIKDDDDDDIDSDKDNKNEEKEDEEEKEEDEDEDEDDEDEDEDEDDEDDDDDDEEKEEGDNDDKEKDKDNINIDNKNKIDTNNNDDEKGIYENKKESEKNKKNSEESSKLYLSNINPKEEVINTDIKKDKIENKDTFGSKVFSDREEIKSN